MSAKHYRMVMHNSRSMATRVNKAKPNWAFAMLLFCCGSTYAWQACRYMGVDPDAVTVGDVWRSEDPE